MAISCTAAPTTADARSLADREFLSRLGWGEARRARLAGDASFRHYDRLWRGTESAVLMDAAPPREDVRPFVAVARWLASHGFAAPGVIGAHIPHGFLLLEDLGDDRYSRVIAADPALERPLYEAAIDVLAALHNLPAPASLPLAEGGAHEVQVYDQDLYLRELLLFADWYMPAALGRVLSAAERAEFVALWTEILGTLDEGRPVMVLRDYHADNLMWLPGRGTDAVRRVGLLDFQDAVRGHAAYDLVSLLEDARRDVAPEIAADMIERYLAQAPAGDDPAAFRRAYAILGAQRNMKIIGIFTRLFARDGKAHYLSLLPRVWRHLAHDLAHPALAPLREWVARMLPATCMSGNLDPAAVRHLPKQAVVLAAGLGLRMRPLTEHLPKPLLPVAGRTMLDRSLDALATAGVDNVVVNMHHLPHKMRDHLATRAGQLPAVSLSDESAALLDSGGGVKRALSQIGAGAFYVLNGDMIWRDRGADALQRLAMAFDPDAMDGILLLVPRQAAHGYDGPGDFHLAPDGRLTRRGDAAHAPYVFTGIQILKSGPLAAIPGEVFSLNRVYDHLLAEGRLFGLIHDGDWFHVGTPEALRETDALLRGGEAT